MQDVHLNFGYWYKNDYNDRPLSCHFTQRYNSCLSTAQLSVDLDCEGEEWRNSAGEGQCELQDNKNQTEVKSQHEEGP